MAHPPHYQRLHNDTEDLEQGSEPGSEEQLGTHESSPLLKTFYSLSSSLSSFSSSLLSHYSPQISSIQQRPLVLAFLSLLITSTFFATWSISTVPAARTLDQPSFFDPTPGVTHYQLWPPQENGGRDESLRYTLIPFLPTSPASNIPPGPQSPPQNIPLDALGILFNPSSLPRIAASGFRLPPDLEAFFNEHTTFDIVWTWVNGSDPLHRQALADAEKSALTQRRRALEERSGLPFVEPAAAEINAAIIARSVTAPKLFRDHDELRYSLRSVLQYFGPHVNGFHVVAGDFADPRPADTLVSNVNNGTAGGESTAPQATATNSSPAVSARRPSTAEPPPATAYRFGQIPQWLNDDTDVMDPILELDVNTVALNFHYHSQFFAQYEKPTFNSFAIETQMSRIQGIKEHFIYMNDDYFFYDTVRPADFYTPAYGIVLRFQPDLLVTSANPSHDDKHGEWRPLHYSNWLLDQRYGARPRPYMVHAGKSMSLSLLRELGSFRNFVHKSPSGEPEEATMGGVFRDALLTTAKHTFRGQYWLVKDHDDTYVTFLFAHHVVERWREALLWSWVVGRVGGDDDEWTTDSHRATAWVELGGLPCGNCSEIPDVRVASSLRETLDRDTVINILGGQSATSYSFSSLDGYPYSFLSTKGAPSWPQMTDKSHWLYGKPDSTPRLKIQECQISLDTCFPTTLNRSSEVFKHVAFGNPACGDCIIRRLVIASGKTGIEAFLPPVDRVAKYAFGESLSPAAGADNHRDPFLPLESSWKDIDYSLKSVLAPWAKEFTETPVDHEDEHKHRHSTKGHHDRSWSQTQLRGVNVREWAMRAMARYRFVLGETPFDFVMLRSPYMTARQLREISKKDPRPAMVCINDDIKLSNHFFDEVIASATETLKSWMASTWSTKTWWER